MNKNFCCSLLDFAAQHLLERSNGLFFNDLFITIIKVKVKSLCSALFFNSFQGIEDCIIAEFNSIKSIALTR